MPTPAELGSIPNMRWHGEYILTLQELYRWFGDPVRGPSPPVDGIVLVSFFPGPGCGLLGYLRVGLRIRVFRGLELSVVCRDICMRHLREWATQYPNQLAPGAIDGVFDWASDILHDAFNLSPTYLHQHLHVPDLVDFTPPQQGMTPRSPFPGFLDRRCRAGLAALSAVAEWHALLLAERRSTGAADIRPIFGYWAVNVATVVHFGKRRILSVF